MANTMAAVVQYDLKPGSVEVREVPVPEINEDEVLLKVGEAANDDGLMKGTAKRAADECGQLRAATRNRLVRIRCCSKRMTCERLLGHRASPL